MTTDGRPYLGAALGTQEYIASQVESQPHATFSALTHGLMNKWTYLSRTIPDIGPLLTPLDHVLCSVLLPALTGRPPPSKLECKLFALPARMGGLGISTPSKTATQELHSSQLITSTLCEHILSQDPEYGYKVIAKQLEAKTRTGASREPCKNLYGS